MGKTELLVDGKEEMKNAGVRTGYLEMYLDVRLQSTDV